MGGLKKTVFRLMLVSMTLIGGQLFSGTPVFGVTDASITITTNTALSLSLNPGTFGSTSQTISVTTDNYTGYTASLTNPTNSTNLVNTSDNSLTIPTITLPQGSNSIIASQFTSGYGLSTDGTNYVPAPTNASSLSIGSRNSAGSGSYSLTFGALPAVNTTAINLYAIWGSAGRIIHDTTTTVYSPSAVPAGYTVYFDNPNIEGNPVVTADDDGNIVSFEYTNTGSSGISFATGHTLDTGILAFDDTGFTIHLVVKINPKNNGGKRLVSAFQQNSGSSTYAGFTFYCYSNQYFYLDASTSAGISSTSFGTHINSSGWRVQSNQEQTFTLDITYTPSPNKSISATFTPVRSGSSSSFSSSDTNLMAYIPNSLSNATIILSGNGIPNDTSKDLSGATVYEFSVTKP